MEGNGSVDMLSEVLENQFLQAVKLVGNHLDSETQKLDQIGEDELELLKETGGTQEGETAKTRMAFQRALGILRNRQRETQEVKESEKVVCHFYRNTTFRCKILDRHLAILAKNHLVAKFLKLNVEKVSFLCERRGSKSSPH